MEYLFKADMVEIGEVIIRSLFSLLTLFFLTKLLGKKQVSQLSLFDYVIGISIGNFAAEISINTDVPYINGIVAVIVFGLFAYLISVGTMKSIILRRFFIGTPTVLIQNGNLMYKNMKKVKFDVNDLLEECRNNNYFDVSQIEYALLEANGKLSILPKSDNTPLTRKDMNVKSEKAALVANIIIDGKFMNNNIKNMNKDISWIKSNLKVMGYKNISNILLATLDTNEKINVYLKDDNIKPLTVIE